MSSDSDSDECFESADEDLDFTNNETINKKTHETKQNNETVNKKTLETKENNETVNKKTLETKENNIIDNISKLSLNEEKGIENKTILDSDIKNPDNEIKKTPNDKSTDSEIQKHSNEIKTTKIEINKPEEKPKESKYKFITTKELTDELKRYTAFHDNKIKNLKIKSKESELKTNLKEISKCSNLKDDESLLEKNIKSEQISNKNENVLLEEKSKDLKLGSNKSVENISNKNSTTNSKSLELQQKPKVEQPHKEKLDKVAAGVDGWDVDPDLSITKLTNEKSSQDVSVKTVLPMLGRKSLALQQKLKVVKPIKEKLDIATGGVDGWDIDPDVSVKVTNKTSPKSFESHLKLEIEKVIKEKIDADTAGADSGDVDGWDVEPDVDIDVKLEDGFEVPLDLQKTSSNSSQQQSGFPFALSKLTKDTGGDSWGTSWGSWGGVGSILSTATSGVTTLTSQVSQGFSQVLGAPDPADLARLDNEWREQQQQQKLSNQKKEEPKSELPLKDDSSLEKNSQHPVDPTNNSTTTGPTGLFSLSQFTKLVETTSSNIIAGGLDTLENIGKKTMEVLQDGDPGLKKKRAVLFPNQNKPNLSHVLRDAKEKNENKSTETTPSSSTISKSSTPKTIHFETLLDDFQGLVHLEALEMLSKQSSIRLNNELLKHSANSSIGTSSSKELNEFQETLQQIREMCQVDDNYDEDEDDDDDEDEERDDDDEDEERDDDEVKDNKHDKLCNKIEEIIKLYDLEKKLNCDKLIKVHKTICNQIERVHRHTSCDSLYEECLRSMAELTAIAMDVFNKTANLLVLKSKHKIIDETEALTQFTYLLCSRVTWISSIYSKSMMNLEPDSALITNVYLEAANSCSYIQDASQLIIPIIQAGAVPLS